jgi:hypothetical protein
MKHNKKIMMIGSGVLILSIMLLLGIFLPFIPSGNADINSTAELNTTVNITNSAPEVRNVVLQDPIILNAYGNVTVSCNATVFDWDVPLTDNITAVNATLFLQTVANHSNIDDKNNHYTNSSCVNITAIARETNYSCTFKVEYYANNGSAWNCRVYAYDRLNATHSNVSINSTLQALVAIYVPGVLDFGQMVYDNISADTLANITNAGNRNVTLNVSGYGTSKYDGLAMNCSYGTIPLAFMKYNITPLILNNQAVFNNMTNLTNTTKALGNINFTVFHREDDSTEVSSTNITYWRLKIPPIAAGICSGKILFEASDLGK